MVSIDKAIQLAERIVTLKNDAPLTAHPEWGSIVTDAQTALGLNDPSEDHLKKHVRDNMSKVPAKGAKTVKTPYHGNRSDRFQ